MENPGITTTFARPLRIGDIAPDFAARTTRGDIRLSDYRGGWLLFFSHPADFTPVCTTEFVEMAKAADDFAQAGCALLGLSVDSLYAHLAWLRAIKDHFGIEIPFPLIEDPGMAIGQAYGMIDADTPDSAAMRTSYFIDPAGVIRATSTYPHNVGRSIPEMLRLLRALQASDSTGHFAPAGWQPGAPMLRAGPLDASAVADGPDWFCREVEA